MPTLLSTAAFRDFGLPSGMVVIDGQLISAGTGDYPVLVLSGGKAELREIDSRLYLKVHRAEAADGGNRDAAGTTLPGAETAMIEIDNINFPGGGSRPSSIPLSTAGQTGRQRNITATVQNGVVTSIAEYGRKADTRRRHADNLLALTHTGKRNCR